MASTLESAIESNPHFVALVCQLSALTSAVSGPADKFETYEATGLTVSNLIVRAMLKNKLQAVSDGLGEEVLIDGDRFRRHQEGKVAYHSLCGSLEVQRYSYRRCGERNGATVIPLELTCSLVERATPALSYSVTLGYAQGELRGYAEGLDAAHRALPSRSTLERMGKALGTEAKEQAPKIEAVLRQTEQLPEGTHAISMGLDRVAVPMEEDREEDAPGNTRRKKRTEPYERTPPTPVDVNYRMAYVGTVSMVNDEGEALITRRYTALPDAEPDEVVKGVMEDVLNGLRQNGELNVGVVQDGAPEMWNAMGRGLRAAGVEQWTEGIDRYHLDERLAAALQLIEPNASVRKGLLTFWNADLDSSDEAIDRIQAWLGEKVDKVKGHESEGKYLGHLVYLENNQARMRYLTIKQKGLPIGSGVTEGACKSVVGQRARGSGQRWRTVGLSAALTLRAIHRSDRLPGFWAELAKGYSAEIRNVA